MILRSRKLKSGQQSFYLDGYPHSRSISLGFRVEPGTDKKIVKETMRLVRNKAALIQNELMKPEIYSEAELKQLEAKGRGSRLFKSFCKETMNGSDVYRVALLYFDAFAPDLRCNQLTNELLTGFRKYLLTVRKIRTDEPISKKSASVYLAALKSMANSYDSTLIVEGIDPGEHEPQALAISELRALSDTPCAYPGLKEMALFSALTGLRFIDCKQLQRSQVKQNANGWYLDFTQQKTGKENILPISDQAHAHIGENMFSGVNYKNMQRALKSWMKAAGVSPEATFHSFRHTYAMLLLGNGADVFTVSRMLGHRSLSSTQVYVKALETNKLKAANSIQL